MWKPLLAPNPQLQLLFNRGNIYQEFELFRSFFPEKREQSSDSQEGILTTNQTFKTFTCFTAAVLWGTDENTLNPVHANIHQALGGYLSVGRELTKCQFSQVRFHSPNVNAAEETFLVWLCACFICACSIPYTALRYKKTIWTLVLSEMWSSSHAYTSQVCSACICLF